MRFNIGAVVAVLLLCITSTTFALPTDNQLIAGEQAEVLDARSNENGLFAHIKDVWKRKGGGGGGGKGGGSSSSGSGSSSSGSSSSGSSSSSSSSGKTGYVGSLSPSSSSGSGVSSGGGSSQGLSSGSTSEGSSWSGMSSSGRDSSSSSTPGESWNSNGAGGGGGSTSYRSSSPTSKEGYVRRSSPPKGSSTSGKSWWEREKEKWRKAAEMPKEYRGKSAADILGGDKFCNGPCMTMACILYCAPEQRHRTDKRSLPLLENPGKATEHGNRTWSPSEGPDPKELNILLEQLHSRALPAPPSTPTPKIEFEIPPPGHGLCKSTGAKVRRSKNRPHFSWDGSFNLPVDAAGPLVSRSPPKGAENSHNWEWLKDASQSDLDRLDGIEKLPKGKQHLVTRLGISGGSHGSSSRGHSGSSGGHSGSGSSSSGFSSSGSHESGSESSSPHTDSNGEHSSSSSSAGKSSTGKGSSSSNTGGSTKTGSGVTPAYGGGRYYGGGATIPYTAGSRSPLGIAAVPLAFGAAALAVYPGFWLYGAYAYPYSHPYIFHNSTAPANSTNSTNTRRDILDKYPTLLNRQSEDTGVNETKPVTCLCAMYAECGCDDNGNTTFLDSIIGDGTYSNLNLSLVNVADINGTSTIVLNGTLPNGTTASGGTDNANAAGKPVVQGAGYWVMVAIVGATVYMV